MREKFAAAALLLLLGCQCGSRSAQKVAAPANPIDANEIVNATGTAAPYVHLAGPREPARQPVSGDTREEDRDPARAGQPEREPEPASEQDDPLVPTTGPFAEEAPAEQRDVPADLPVADAGVEPALPDAAPPSAPLENAGDPLSDPDAHRR